MEEANGLYILKTMRDKGLGDLGDQALAIDTGEAAAREAALWHFRLAHLGAGAVQRLSTEDSLTDAKALEAALANSKLAHCDFNYSVAPISTNSQQLSPLTSRVGSLFIPFNHLSSNINKMATVNSHFRVWPTHKAIMTNAKTTDLASIFLLASLHNRNIHVTSVTTKDDIKLIALSKEKGLKVTCVLLFMHCSYLGMTILSALLSQLPKTKRRSETTSLLSTVPLSVVCFSSLPMTWNRMSTQPSVSQTRFLC